MSNLILLISLILLNGCSHIPKTIRQAPLQDIQIQDTKKDFSEHQYKIVRWGGTVIDVVNNEESTDIQVLAFPLNYYGQPNLSKSAIGRFQFNSRNFLDPAMYTKSSEITVSGRLVDVKNQKIGKKALKLPVIESQQIYLWPKYQLRYSNNCDYPPYYSYYRYGVYGYRRSFYRPYGHGRYNY